MSNDLTPNTGWSALRQGGGLAQISILCLGVWLHAANSMLVATTLPSAVMEFGGAHLVSWAFTLYLLGSVLAGSMTGLLVSQWGLKPAIMGAVSLYTAGTIICAITPNMEIMLFGRLTQGLGGGGLVALTFVAVNRWYDSHVLPRAMALISAVWSTSAFMGPLIGGSFATYGNWRMAFWLFVLQAFVFVVLALFIIKPNTTRVTVEKIAIPVVRLSVLTGAVLAMAMAGIYFNFMWSIIFAATSLLLLWKFLRLDAQAPAKMFPSDPFTLGSRRGAGMTLLFLASASGMSFLVFGTFLLERLFDATPLVAGYIVAIESVAWGVGAVTFAGVQQSREKLLIHTGSFFILITLVGYAFALASDLLWWVAICALFQGLGFGMMWGFVAKRVIADTDNTERDVASSSIPTTEQIGFALGAAATGLVANSLGFDESMTNVQLKQIAFWLFAAFTPLMLYANFAAWKLLNNSH
jgi:MFS family permease